MVHDHWETRPDGRTVRVLRDPATGRKWRVWEADAAQVPGARGPTCLIFDAGDLVRRSWHVPDDWRRMAPDALVGLASAALRRADDRVALGLPAWASARGTEERGGPAG